MKTMSCDEQKLPAEAAEVKMMEASSREAVKTASALASVIVKRDKRAGLPAAKRAFPEPEVIYLSDDSDDNESVAASKKPTKRAKKDPAVVDLMEDSDDDEFSSTVKVAKANGGEVAFVDSSNEDTSVARPEKKDRNASFGGIIRDVSPSSTLAPAPSSLNSDEQSLSATSAGVSESTEQQLNLCLSEADTQLFVDTTSEKKRLAENRRQQMYEAKQTFREDEVKNKESRRRDLELVRNDVQRQDAEDASTRRYKLKKAIEGVEGVREYENRTDGELTVLEEEQRQITNESFSHRESSKKLISEANKGQPTWNKGTARTLSEKENISTGSKTRNNMIILEGLAAYNKGKPKSEHMTFNDREKLAKKIKSHQNGLKKAQKSHNHANIQKHRKALDDAIALRDALGGKVYNKK